MLKKFKEFLNEDKYQSDHELDRILDKIAAHGVGSITPQEKAYLDGEKTDEPQYDGNYMDNNSEDDDIDNNKDSYMFKVFSLEDNEIAISVFDRRGKFMIDQHICDEIFPELEQLDLEDLAEGEIGYSGNLSKRELIEELRKMGFYAIESNPPY